MRTFKTSFFNDIVDLDDPTTYEDLPKNPKELDDRMFKNIGHTLCYMDIFRKEVYVRNKKYDGGQRKRVMKLINTFCVERPNHYDDVLWLQEQVYLFEDETENMC